MKDAHKTVAAAAAEDAAETAEAEQFVARPGQLAFFVRALELSGWPPTLCCQQPGVVQCVHQRVAYPGGEASQGPQK